VKRTLTIILLLIIHAYSAFSLSTMANSAQNFRSLAHYQHSTYPEKPQSCYSNPSAFITSGAESVVVNFGFNLLKLPQRTNVGSENEYRIRNFKLLMHQKFACTNTSTILFLAFNQFDGYYLYHLRKLLI